MVKTSDMLILGVLGYMLVSKAGDVITQTPAQATQGVIDTLTSALPTVEVPNLFAPQASGATGNNAIVNQGGRSFLWYDYYNPSRWQATSTSYNPNAWEVPPHTKEVLNIDGGYYAVL